MANIDDYLSNNNIKGHENTYKKKMQDRVDQMVNIETQIGPIYMSYPKDNDIHSLLISFTKDEPNCDFESFDKSHHKLWCVNIESDILKISKN